MRWQCPKCNRVVRMPDHAFRVMCPCGYRGQFAAAPPRVLPRNDADRAARLGRVRAAKAQQDRLIAWLQLLRLPGEAGIGDTAARLLGRVRRKKCIAAELLERLMHQCSCSREDAIANLNRNFPYDGLPSPSIFTHTGATD